MHHNSERAPLEMTYISFSLKVICDGAKRKSGGGGGSGGVLPLPVHKTFCIMEPGKKKYLMHIWGKYYYRIFPPNIARGKTIIIEALSMLFQIHSSHHNN